MCTEYDETERCCLYISRKKEKTASTDDILVFHYIQCLRILSKQFKE